MATKGKRPMRALTAGDKIEAIQRVNDGESKASVARDIGVPESTLRGWCKNEDKLRYMSSRRSSPDTDKSTDGDGGERRARTESPAAPASPPPSAGLDLSAPAAPPPAPAPVELTTRRDVPPAPAPQPPRDRRADPGASVSMSAISPLSGLAHMPLSHSHHGLSFNDIATNISLLAQLNPGLSALAAAPASRALRSVRSPKPAHNGALNLSDKHRGAKPHHSEHYSARSKPKDPVDDTLWYWLKTQQALLDLTAQSAAHPLPLAKQPEPKPAAPVAPAAPLNPHLDYNRNTWIWQYYKQFGGAMPLPEDKHRSASQVPKEKTSENILYSHLTKRKSDEEDRLSPKRTKKEETVEPRHGGAGEPARSPEAGVENKEPAERAHDAARSSNKARTVLDNLLFNNNNNNSSSSRVPAGDGDEGAWEAGAADALEHGDKFLAWLEASGDPSVTRMHVHQLRALLQNLRARRLPPAAAAAVGDAARRH